MSTQTTPLSLKILVFIQILIGLGAAALGSWLVNLSLGASIGIGAGMMVASVLFYAWVSARLIAKKSIAWTRMVIVFKYAVLLESIFCLMLTSWFSPIGAGLGIASFTIAALLFAALDYRKR